MVVLLQRGSATRATCGRRSPRRLKSITPSSFRTCEAWVSECIQTTDAQRRTRRPISRAQWMLSNVKTAGLVGLKPTRGRRHGAAEEGVAFGRGRAAILALGKTANCQTLVSLTLARDEVPVMIGLRLFLPEELDLMPTGWRRPACPRTGGRRGPSRRLRWPRSIASAPLAFGLRRCWRMQAMAGRSPFRQGLEARGLKWAVGIPKQQKSSEQRQAGVSDRRTRAAASAPYPRSALLAG